MTAVSLGSSSACISKVSINAAGVSIIGKFRCPGVSYDVGRSPFSLSKILLKKIVLSFSPFGNPFLELVGVGATRDRPYYGRWTSYRAAVHFVGQDLYGSWFPVLGLLENDFSSLNVLF